METDFLTRRRAQQREYAKALEEQIEEHRLKYRPERAAPSPTGKAAPPLSPSSPSKRTSLRDEGNKFAIKLPQLPATDGTPLTPSKATTLHRYPSFGDHTLVHSHPETESLNELTTPGELRSLVRQLQLESLKQTQLIQRVATDIADKHKRLLERLEVVEEAARALPSSITAPPVHHPLEPFNHAVQTQLMQQAERLAHIERCLDGHRADTHLRADYDLTTSMLLENKAHVMALVTALGDRLCSVEQVTTQSPTWNHVQEMEAKAVESIEKHCANVERKLVSKLKETLVSRDRLHDERRETHDVLAHMGAESLARVHEASHARMAALEAQLQEERRTRVDLETAVKHALDQVGMATEVARCQHETAEKSAQTRWAKWTAQQHADSARQTQDLLAAVADANDAHDRAVAATATAWTHETTALREMVASLERVIGAEIRKRAADVSELKAAASSAAEQLCGTWRREVAAELAPVRDHVATLLAQMTSVAESARLNRDVEAKLVAMHQQFVLKQQDILSAFRIETETRVFAAADDVKTLQREAALAQLRLHAMEKRVGDEADVCARAASALHDQLAAVADDMTKLRVDNAKPRRRWP
ncbi:Aste57867_24700 [Aphanomyces stellatus]|uniref:Aste57867_24700 protein n=1 Tax=Aphanomyces stellatus TaxID=120398 RepID=A0A485LVE4_9STRA|nr:hypothetical protein As57867_024622 [Aphanomyces stellatus]VFU01337.1 Aste57867_24700 [Aphanomyces stellatus]